MAARIIRFQEAINKYMITKSNFLADDNVNSMAPDFDYFVSIVFLSVVNSQKNKTTVSISSGYVMACGLEFITQMVRMNDRAYKYRKDMGQNKYNRIMMTYDHLAIYSMSKNVEQIYQLTNKDKVMKIYNICLKYMIDKLMNIMDTELFETTNEYITKTDVIRYDFKIDNPKKKLMGIKQAKQDKLLEWVKRKYGSLMSVAFVMSWMLTRNDDKMIPQLETIANHFGVMYKIVYDFEHLESDLNNATDISSNMVINYGIQDMFELYNESKVRFIEGCIMMEMYSNTIKEVIDVMETKIDHILDNTDVDMRSHLTLKATNGSS